MNGTGIYKYDGTWTWITGSNPEDMIAYISIMAKIIKTLTVSILTCAFFLSIPSYLPAREGSVDLTLEGDSISANLKEIPLRDILEKLEAEKGIWWRGDESVLSERISVQFKELSLEDGMLQAH